MASTKGRKDRSGCAVICVPSDDGGVAKALLPELTPAVPALTAVDGNLRPLVHGRVDGLHRTTPRQPAFRDGTGWGVEGEGLRRWERPLPHGLLRALGEVDQELDRLRAVRVGETVGEELEGVGVAAPVVGARGGLDIDDGDGTI